MTIYNGTTHEIKFYNEADTYPVQGGRKLILKEGANPIKTIPNGVNLNAASSFTEEGEVEGVPVKALAFDGVDNPYEVFPESKEGDFFIVSNLYRAAAREVGSPVLEGRFLTVGGTVYSDESNTRPCGCLYFVEG